MFLIVRRLVESHPVLKRMAVRLLRLAPAVDNRIRASLSRRLHPPSGLQVRAADLPEVAAEAFEELLAATSGRKE